MNKKILLVFLFISTSECFIFNNKFSILKNTKNMIMVNNKKIYKKFILNNKKIPKLVKYYIHNKFSLKEVERKHARIAMLAVIGRIFYEVIHPVIALNLYSTNLLVNNQLVPFFLNGANCIFYFLLSFYIFIMELNHLIILTDITQNKKNITQNDNKNILKNLELNYGRLSMLISPLFAYYEVATKSSIIPSFEFLFVITILILTTIISFLT